MSINPTSSLTWTKEKAIMMGYTRLTKGGGFRDSLASYLDDEEGHGARLSKKFSSGTTTSKFFYEDDESIEAMELPPDFVILPVYDEIMEEPLPPMQVFPPFQPEGEDIEAVIMKMDSRIRKNPSYKAFLEETKNLLTYVLQEIRRRRTMQSMLSHRENEMKAFNEFQRRDPRVSKVIALADHWRKNKEESEEKAEKLVQEIQTLTADTKVLESKLTSMQKRHERLEAQIARHRICEKEKDRLEEKVMAKEKTAIHLADQMEQLTEAMKTITNDSVQKEADFKAKLEAAPDRNALKVAALTRELEGMTIEKEYKMFEVKELQAQVNALMNEKRRSSDRVRLLKDSVMSLKGQWKTMELRHRIVVSKNKGLTRQIEAQSKSAKVASADYLSLQTDNNILKKRVAALTQDVKKEATKYESVLRNVSGLETQIKTLKRELEQSRHENAKLEKNIELSNKTTKKSESQLVHSSILHHKQSERVADLQKKMTRSLRLLKIASNNLRIMNDEIDRTGELLRGLKMDLNRCQEENVKNNSTITHLYQLLDCSENMVRLQIKENDALVINKHRLVDSIRQCVAKTGKLGYDVSRLHSFKTSLEDAALIQKFMLDFVENEREGAVRKGKMNEDAVVILQRKQVVRIAQLARANAHNSRLLIQVADLNRQLNMQKQEVQNLTKDLQIVENFLIQRDFSYRSLLSQRDMFGARILQQNNEMEMVEMKIAAMSKMMDIGNTSYRDRCHDILVLKKEIQTLRKKVKTLEHVESINRELRTEMIFLNRGRTIEMARRKALESCKMPNVHRFREIQSKDPSVYEMILKIQSLQKNLIRKTQECIEKEKEIAIRNDSIEALKKAVSRRENKMDNKVNESEVKSIVDKKNQTIKALTAELNMLRFYFTDDRKLTEEQRQELATSKLDSQLYRRSKSASVSWSSDQTSQSTSIVEAATHPQNTLKLRPKPKRSGQVASERAFSIARSRSNNSS